MNNTFEIKEYIVYSKRIGSGAFSSIHKAYKRHTNRFYAVKKLNYDSKSLSSNTYKKEFSILRKIEHKNIIKLHDIILDKNNEHIYLVLDYYKNGDLSQFLKNRSLKEKYAKGYMFQLKDGLEYLIQKSIIIYPYLLALGVIRPIEEVNDLKCYKVYSRRSNYRN